MKNPLLAIVLMFALAACGGVAPREVMQTHQQAYNDLVKLENIYAAQPFCGSIGAPQPPACADANAVIKMADYSTKASDLLAGGWNAANSIDMDEDKIDAIISSVGNALGEFGAILAQWGVKPPPTP